MADISSIQGSGGRVADILLSKDLEEGWLIFLVS